MEVFKLGPQIHPVAQETARSRGCHTKILEYIGVGYDFQVQKLYSRTVVQVFIHDPEEVC